MHSVVGPCIRQSLQQAHAGEGSLGIHPWISHYALTCLKDTLLWAEPGAVAAYEDSVESANLLLTFC